MTISKNYGTALTFVFENSAACCHKQSEIPNITHRCEFAVRYLQNFTRKHNFPSPFHCNVFISERVHTIEPIIIANNSIRLVAILKKSEL